MKSLLTNKSFRILATIIGPTIAFALVFGLLSMPSRAQLQQSGGAGSTVTVSSITNALPSGSNVIGHVINDAGAAVIGHVIVDTTSTTAVTQATGTNLHTVVDSGTITAVTGITNALPAGGNVIGIVNTIPKTACGNTVASQPLAAVPTSSTAVFTSTTCIVVIVMNNTNGSSASVTVTDNAGTPINNNLTFAIPASSQLIQPLWGVAFTTGLKWSASSTGVTGAVLGYQ